MKKLLKAFFILVICIFILGSSNVLAATTGILLEGETSVKKGETKTLDVKLQADTDMRRSAIQYRE